MRFTAAAITLFLATPASPFAIAPTAAFVPRKSVPIDFRRESVINHFSIQSGGVEELIEFAQPEEQSQLKNVIQKKPSLVKMASIASIPLSAALGFGLVPSRNIAANVVGAIITGIAGAVGKSKMDLALIDNFALQAIAKALLEDSGEALEKPEDAAIKVKQVQVDYGIPDEDFAGMCTDMYVKFLLGMVKYQSQAKTGELKELKNMKTALSLENLQIGEAHAAAAASWYRTTTLVTAEEDLEDEDNAERKAMDKLLFLTERSLRQQDETEEAFRFEMTRIAKSFKLSFEEAMERVADVVEPFYLRALKSTRTKLGTDQVSSAMLERARKTLGVSDETSHDMHVSCVNEEVRSLLGKTSEESEEEMDSDSLKFAEGTMERLNELQEVLELSDADISYEITSEATPLFQEAALAAMKDVLGGSKSPDKAWEIMDARRKELLVNSDVSRSLISSMVMQALGGPLEECNKFSKVNNEAAAYDHLLEALQAKEALISILAKSGWEQYDKFDETFCNPANEQSANGFISSTERNKLYRTFMSRSIRKSEDGFLTDEMEAKVQEVKGLLGISDQQALMEARGAFGPVLQKVLERAMTEIVEDCTPELVQNLQTEVDEVVEKYRIDAQYLSEVGSTFYDRAVGLVSAKSPAGIPTEQLFEALNSLRELYKLDKEDTYPSHMEYFGSVYKKSVLEAMGTTGVIRPEFRGALNELRDRLGVSEANCKKVFLEAVTEKMVPMVEWIGSEMERTMLTQKQIAQRRKKDIGEDVFQTGKGADGVLGLGAEINIMGDIMNLVDFYGENDIAEQVEVGKKEVEKKEGEGTEEVPVYETTFPVTALGEDAIDQEMAEVLYRQFVVGGFTTQGPQGARYEGARATFGGILGLTSAKMEEINDKIGSTVYDNFVSNAMKTKGAMDQQDMMFLANIQTKLGLSSEQGEKMMLESQKKVLSEEIDSLMDNPSPQGVKMFREKCNSMGMDLSEDVGISKLRLTRMFEAEVVPGLESGEITIENNDLIVEIQESLGLEGEECQTMLENVLVTLARSAMNYAEGELLRGREGNAVTSINNIIQYAAFVEGDLGIETDEATGYKIFNVYEAIDLSGEDEETVERNKELLKLALGLS